MEAWKQDLHDLCELSELILPTYDLRLACKACKCHVPDEKPAVLSHLNGNRHGKALRQYLETKATCANYNEDMPGGIMKAQTWKECTEPSHEEVPENFDCIQPQPFVGSIIAKTGNIWKDAGTEIDKEAFKNFIRQLDDDNMNALWGEEKEELQAAPPARLKGFDDRDRISAKTDTFLSPGQGKRFWTYFSRTPNCKTYSRKFRRLPM